MKYAKLVDGRLSFAPVNMVKDGKTIFNYHLQHELLLADGFFPLEEKPLPPDMRQPVKYYWQDGNKIIGAWRDDYIAPVLTYAEKRAAEYPDPRDYLDAEVKLNSGYQDLIAEGEKQKKDYVAACLAVKAKYPKN